MNTIRVKVTADEQGYYAQARVLTPDGYIDFETSCRREASLGEYSDKARVSWQSSGSRTTLAEANDALRAMNHMALTAHTFEVGLQYAARMTREDMGGNYQVTLAEYDL